MTEKEFIKLWKELKIDHINFNFSCGGDSMDETSIEIYDSAEELIKNDEIELFIDKEVYNRVDFYEASDGHYMGESGVVEITLDESDEEPYLSYDKQSSSEWYETFTEIAKLTLTDEEAKFVSEYVSNINGGDDNEGVINYKDDCILSDKEEVIAAKLLQKIDDFSAKLEIDSGDANLNGSFTYTTNSEESEVTDLTLVGNELTLIVSISGYVYKDEDY